MAWRPSAALRNFMLEGGSLKSALSNCVIKVYTGAQPATAEAAPTGTLLCTYTDASGAATREVLALGVVTLSGSAGSVDTFTVNSLEIMGSAVSFDTDLSTTAAAVATKINDNPKNQLFVATSSGAVITISAKPGMGSLYNGKAISVGTTTMSAAVTSTTFGSGTGGGTAGVTAANCLKWGDASEGILTKLSTQTWSGVAVASGTAGWFRIEASVTDPGTLDSSEAIIRCDGAVATSGAELNMTPTTIASGATQTISSFAVTLPTA